MKFHWIVEYHPGEILYQGEHEFVPRKEEWVELPTSPGFAYQVDYLRYNITDGSVFIKAGLKSALLD